MERAQAAKKPSLKPRRRRKSFPSPLAEEGKKGQEEAALPSFVEVWIARGRPAPVELALSLGLDPREALQELRRYRANLAGKEASPQEVLLRAMRLAQQAGLLEEKPELPPKAVEALAKLAALLPLLEEGWHALIQE